MRFIRFRIVLPAMLGVVLLVGCGESHDPVTGGVDQGTAPAVQQASDSRSTAANRVLWGLWKINVSADRETITVVPDRTGALHFNVVRLIEVAPCSDCLRIKNVKGTADGLSADVILIHPFPGLLQYTGFDVRGIFISGARYTFPVSGRKIAWGDDVARMLNSDGYTHLFNPTNFPYTNPPILGYIPAHKAPGGDLSATLNPYVAYEQDKPRCMFMPGTVSTRTVFLYLPPGPLEFGYAVDASWFPAGGEVTDPINDFPPEANCMEAYRIDVQLGQALSPTVGSAAQVQVEVYDHQGLDTIESVTIEAPDLFSGERALSFSTATGEESFLFTGIVTNELGPDCGHYPLLVRIVDTEADGNLGTVNGFQLARISIAEGWARTWGQQDRTLSYAVSADGTGNIYVAGSFYGTVDFDPEGGDPHTANVSDVFLSKFDSSGDFDWARTWGGSAYDSGRAVAADGSGNVYVTGKFAGTVDFDPEGGDPHTSNGHYEVFLSKFDSWGNFEWARTWGGSYDDSGSGVAADSSGNVYVTGLFWSTTDFDPGGGDPHSTNGMSDVFLSKFDSSGNFEWGRTWGGPEWDVGCGVAADGSGNVYVAGSFCDTVDFDPEGGGDPHTSNGSEDAFLSKFDSSGDFEWARTWGGSKIDRGLGVAADAIGNLYVAGRFTGTVDFDPGGGEPHTSNGDEDVFLSKFDSSGDFEWARTWAGPNSDSHLGTAADGSGYVYVAGQFMGTVDFDPDGGDPHTSNGWEDVFLTKFDSSGNFEWARTWGGPDWDHGYGVATDGFGSIYSTGWFLGTVDFAPTGPPCNEDPDEHDSGEYRCDSFLTKHLPDGCW